MKTSLWRFLSSSCIAQVAFLLLAAWSSSAVMCNGTVCTLSPSDASTLASIVASHNPGTKFVFTKGTYRITESIIPLAGDTFVGQDSCSPPTTSCDAVLEGSTNIGGLATFDGTNYEVANQTQHGTTAPTKDCLTGWFGCIYPEDLFFDGKPYQHLYSSALPTIGPGQWWFDYTNHIIYFHDSPSGHTVETSVLNNAFGGTANNVTIQYLTIEEFANMYPTGAIGVDQGASVKTQGANWIVKNCEVALNHGFGVRVAYNEQILNNYIYQNGQLGIGGGIGALAAGTVDTSGTTVTLKSGTPFSSSWTGSFYIGTPPSIVTYTLSSCSSNQCTLTTSAGMQTGVPYTFVLVPQSTNSLVLIQGNTINNNNFAHFDPGFGAGGFKVGSTSGVVLRGNTISGNLGSAIHFDDQSGPNTVDGNTITNNSDGSALAQEISFGPSTWRNNILQGNGHTTANTAGPYSAMQGQASTGVEAYCNVIELPNDTQDNAHDNGWTVGAADRMYAAYPPFGYLSSTGNNFHHNSVIWDLDAGGHVGFTQTDNAHQPNFLANNSVPNYNTYHASTKTQSTFIYSDADNAPDVSFANYQTDGADPQGAIDTNYNVGFPAVTITSPANGSSFTNSVAVTASAADKSGIGKVEFYLDWALQGTVTSSPYTFTVMTSVAGFHTIAAMAYSNAGVRDCYAITLVEK